MNRRTFFQAATAASVGASVGGAPLSSASAPQTPAETAHREIRHSPNVLWICTDQLRWDTIQSLGNPHIRTPNLDRLAASGVAFTNTYCQAPICTPSRASFMTGIYPSTLHVNRNGNAYFPERDATRLVSRILADAGYFCGLVGKLHLAGNFERMEPRVDDGFRLFLPSINDLHRTEDSPYDNAWFQWLLAQGVDWRTMDATIKPLEGWPPQYRPGLDARFAHPTWLAEMASSFLKGALRPEGQAGTPWFLFASFHEPHPGNFPPAEYLRKIDVASLPLPKFRESELESQLKFSQVDHQTRKPMAPGSYPTRHMKGAYYAEIEFVDDQVGRILRTLEDTGQRENTLVIFSTDHGDMLGDHGLILKGCRFYEGAVHVPLMMSWPGHFQAGLRSSALVGLIDIVPTLLEAVGVSAPEDFLPPAARGQSLKPILTGSATPHHHRDFVRCEYHDTVDMPGMTHHSHADMIFDGRYKLVTYHGLPVGELYDLREDPDEFQNLWDDPGHAEVKWSRLKQLFDATALATDPGQPRIGRF